MAESQDPLVLCVPTEAIKDDTSKLETASNPELPPSETSGNIEIKYFILWSTLENSWASVTFLRIS